MNQPILIKELVILCIYVVVFLKDVPIYIYQNTRDNSAPLQDSLRRVMQI